MSFVIIDNYDTANVFLGKNMFNAQSYKDIIGEKMIAKFDELTKQLYQSGLKFFYLTKSMVTEKISMPML